MDGLEATTESGGAATTPAAAETPVVSFGPTDILKAFRAKKEGGGGDDEDDDESTGQDGAAPQATDGTGGGKPGEATTATVDPNAPLPPIEGIEQLTTGAGDDEGDPVYVPPALDEMLAKNPEFKKRYDQQEAGFKKVVDQVQAERAEIKAVLPQASRMAELMDRYDRSADDAVGVLQEGLQAAATMHGTTVEALYRQLSAKLGFTHARAGGGSDNALTAAAAGQGADEITDANWDQHFEHREDYEIYRRARDHSDAKWQGKFAALEAKLEALTAGTTRTDEAAGKAQQWKAYLDHYSPGVQGHIRTAWGGFEVTREQIEAAVLKYPQHAKQPVLAVEAHLASTLNGHMAQKRAADEARRAALPRGPEEEANAGVQGVKDPMHIKPSDIRRARKAQLQR